MDDEWIKCYSKSRQRDYYFNQSTGQSVWSLEELNIITNKKSKSPIELVDKQQQPISKIKFKAKDKINSKKLTSSCSSPVSTVNLLKSKANKKTK